MHDLYEKLAELSSEGRIFALCTVIKTQGSTPAKPGAKMIVLPDGTTFGTVGGAEVEFNTKNRSLECIKNAKSEIAQFDLFYKKEGGADLACGGKVEVFIEVSSKPPHVLLCGGGHVSLAISKMLLELGYFYSVFDPRSEYRSNERFASARNLSSELPNNLSNYSHMIIITFSQQLDYDITKKILQSDYNGFVGLIGSKSKRKDFEFRLEKDGVLKERINRLECPLGIDIEAKSVPEIAMSIACAIIKSYRATLQSAAK